MPASAPSAAPGRALADGLWVADRPMPLVIGDLGTRMTVVRLPDGGLWLHSPVRLDAATRAWLDGLGPVRAVVAPNKVHHLFAGDYRQAYPEARLFGAPGLAAKRPDLAFEAELGDDPPALWAGAIAQHLVRGAPFMNEVAFFHAASRTLLLTDLAFNFTTPVHGRAWLTLWLTGALGRFGPTRFERWLLFRDRSAVRASMARVLAWDFERVIVTHGSVLETGGRGAVAAAFASV